MIRARSFAPALMRVSRGFTLVSAIFLLVALAALGAAMLALSTTQQVGSALDFEGARAYQAARAGVEWALYQRLESPQAKNNFCRDVGTASPPSFQLTAPTLAGYTVTVTCTRHAGVHTAPPSVAEDIAQIAAVAGIATVTGDVAELYPGIQVTIGGTVGYNGIYTVESVDVGSGTFTFFFAATPGPETAGTFTPRSQALDRRQIISTACNEPTGAGDCPNPNPAGQFYVQRVVQVEF